MEKLSWHTHEYLHQEKTADWYWVVGIITISIALIAIILNNIIFAILIIISAGTLSLFASKRPEFVEVEINIKGIRFGKITYEYTELDSFWVETRDHHYRILIKTKKLFTPLVVIFIDEVDPETVRIYLSHYLKEEEQAEPLLEKVLIYLGF